MNKKEYIKAVAQRTGVAGAVVEIVLDGMMKEAAAELVSTGQVRVPGIASMVAKCYAARPGRNPKTGEAREVPAAIRIRLKPASALEKEFAALKPQAV